MPKLTNAEIGARIHVAASAAHAVLEALGLDTACLEISSPQKLAHHDYALYEHELPGGIKVVVEFPKGWSAPTL